MSFTVRFSDFHRNPKPELSVFTRALEIVTESDIKIVTDASYLVDLEIASNFIETHLITKAKFRFDAQFNQARWNDYVKTYTRGFRSEYRGKARKRIWYSGENLRAPVYGFDGTISFDLTDPVLNNLYFPYWMYRLNWGFSSNGFEMQPTIGELTAGREPIKRPQTACTFSGVYEPYREKVVKAVAEVMPVHKYGKLNRNPVVSKRETSYEYGYQICNENDLYPNYVTEKLIEAWLSFNIPIWAGLDEHNWFNKSAYINVTDLIQGEIIEKVRSISIEEAIHMRSLPILNRTPDLNPLLKFFEKTLL